MSGELYDGQCYECFGPYTGPSTPNHLREVGTEPPAYNDTPTLAECNADEAKLNEPPQEEEW